MRIPSYDDLTPSIPDVSPGDVLAFAARLLPASGPVAEAASRAASAAAGELFACLRSAPADVLVAIARDFSPRIQRYADAVVLDVAGLGRLLGSPENIGAELRRMGSERGYAGIRVAVAPTQITALLLSLTDRALTVVAAGESAALSPLPLQMLEQFVGTLQGQALLRGKAFGGSSRAPRLDPDADAQAFDALHRWGVQTLGEFAALPAAALSARLGRAGVRLHQLARGIDPQPLVPDPDVPRFCERLELEWPIASLEPLSFVLARLLDPLAAALERADRAAAAVCLELRLVNRTTHRRVLQLPSAIRDPRVLRTLLLLDLESHAPSEAIDIVTIEVDPAPGRVVQFSLLERALPSPETLTTLTARLAALVGESRCGSPLLIDTHRPDAFEMRRFDPQPKRRDRSTDGVVGLSDDKCFWSEHPLGLFTDRTRADAGAILRRFRPPVAVRVALDRGRPAHVAIDRRGMPGGRVVQASGPWRSSGAWWEPAEMPWNRDEWDVELSDGSVCRLFCDRESGVWFLEGIAD